MWAREMPPAPIRPIRTRSILASSTYCRIRAPIRHWCPTTPPGDWGYGRTPPNPLPGGALLRPISPSRASSGGRNLLLLGGPVIVQQLLGVLLAIGERRLGVGAIEHGIQGRPERLRV